MKNYIENICKNNILVIAVLISLFIGIVLCPVFAADKYPRRGNTAVNDFANVLDAQNAARMEALAREVLEKTGTAVVVITVKEVGENEDHRMYANGLYQAWGIGKKGEDKGVLIFLTVKERKIRIETGYGVEGILPDGLTGEILDKYVLPALSAGDYGKGLYNAVYACSAYIAKDAGVQLTGAASPYRTKSRAEKKGVSVFGIIIFLIIAALLVGTKTGRAMLPWILLMLLSGSGGRGGSGGFGGGFGGFGGGGSGGGGSDRSF